MKNRNYIFREVYKTLFDFRGRIIINIKRRNVFKETLGPTVRAIYDSFRTKINQSWFSEIWSTHMCRLRFQIPHVARFGEFFFT